MDYQTQKENLEKRLNNYLRRDNWLKTAWVFTSLVGILGLFYTAGKMNDMTFYQEKLKKLDINIELEREIKKINEEASKKTCLMGYLAGGSFVIGLGLLSLYRFTRLKDWEKITNLEKDLKKMNGDN